MPQWAGSCWYELRYLDPTNEHRFVVRRSGATGWAAPGDSGRRRSLRRWGRARGAAPAVRPLLAQGAVRPGRGASSFEPYRRLFNQGYILAAAVQGRARTDVDSDAVE